MLEGYSGRFRPAYDCEGYPLIVLDTSGAKIWHGKWHDSEHRIDLIRDSKGDWFSGYVAFDSAGLDWSWDHYCAPPGRSLGLQRLSVPDALRLCEREGIPAPEELISAFKELMLRPEPNRAVVTAGTTGQAADADQQAPQPPVDPADLVTLNQAAAMVHKSKRTLERCKTAGKLPAPAVEGGGGKADLYDWKVLGPWLESKFGIRQPKVFPANRRHR